MLTSGVSNNAFESDSVPCAPYPRRRKMKSDLSPSISNRERVAVSWQNPGTIHGLSTLNYCLTMSLALECNN